MELQQQQSQLSKPDHASLGDLKVISLPRTDLFTISAAVPVDGNYQRHGKQTNEYSASCTLEVHLHFCNRYVRLIDRYVVNLHSMPRTIIGWPAYLQSMKLSRIDALYDGWGSHPETFADGIWLDARESSPNWRSFPALEVCPTIQPADRFAPIIRTWLPWYETQPSKGYRPDDGSQTIITIHTQQINPPPSTLPPAPPAPYFVQPAPYHTARKKCLFHDDSIEA